MCRHSAPFMIPRSRHHDENEEQPAKTAGPAGIVRRAFGQGTRPEEELERLLVERAAELEDYAARFEETALELNTREERLRDERASVERLLRQSTAELEAREKELVQFEHELEARDQRLRTSEAQLARRRSDLGAVELKRAALEQRERALDTREAALAAREDRLAEGAGLDVEPRPVELYFVPGSGYRLLEAGEEVVTPEAIVEIDGDEYHVARVGRSPLPGDSRRCAYLERLAPDIAE